MRTNDEMADLFEFANNGAGPDLDSVMAPEDLLAIMRAKNAQAKADAMMVEAVGKARHNGVTWQQIGDMLGVTRQAAHSRYARLAS